VGFLAAVLGLLMLPPPAPSQTGPKIEVVPGQSHAGAVASIAVTVDGTRISQGTRRQAWPATGPATLGRQRRCSLSTRKGCLIG
jgi:hypothetical protein